MRLAGHPALGGDAAIAQALSSYFASAPAGALAPSKPPVSVADGEARLDSFLETHALLRSKGYSPEAAMDLATGVAKGEQPPVKPTLRFAAVYGDAPSLPAGRR